MKKKLLCLCLAFCLAMSLCSGVLAAPAGKYAAVTPTGIEADYVSNTNGYACVLITGILVEGEDLTQTYTRYPQYGLLDRNGNFLLPYRVYSPTVLQESFFYYVSKEGIVTDYKRGYLNLDGTKRLEIDFLRNEQLGSSSTGTDYYNVEPFYDGVAFVREMRSYSPDGSIDNTKEIIRSYLIDTNGNILSTLPDEFNTPTDTNKNFAFSGFQWEAGEAGEGLIAVISQYGLVGYMDYSGQITLTPPNYVYGSAFHNGLAAVVQAETDAATGQITRFWQGYINKLGYVAIPLMYDAVYDFGADGLAAACYQGKWGYINANNETVIPFEYDDAFGAENGLAVVAKDGKFGLVDYNNTVILPLEYDDMTSFEGNVAYAVKDRQLYIVTLSDTPTVDEPSDWAKEQVYAAINSGLVPESLWKGYQQPVTRGQVAEMFVRLIEKGTWQTIDEVLETQGKTIDWNVFTDTQDKNVLAANALGIINGMGDGTFGADQPLQRAQIAAILNRIARFFGISTDGYTHNFLDVPPEHWVYSELGWPSATGIIGGYGDGNFGPSDPLTCEQAIAITYRALNVLRS